MYPGFLPLLAALACGFPGCTVHEHNAFVLDMPSPATRDLETVAIQERGSVVEFPPNLRQYFEEVLKKDLERDKGFRVVPLDTPHSLTLEYRVVGIDAGAAVARTIYGVVSFLIPITGLGDGGLGVEASFHDSSGQRLARVFALGPVEGAFGSLEAGLRTAASSVAKFARLHFDITPLDGKMAAPTPVR
jgi:hypothetical protein